MIHSEHRALRDVLIRRLGKRAKGHEKAFDAIQETSKKMVGALVKHFKQACPDAGEVRLATPTSWSEMVFAFGYRLMQNGIEIEDSAQGSGVQSLLMLETLYLVDRDYFQQFGWRQAAIWGVEEPESSLHSSLEARVAAYLGSISSDSSSRLQVLCTTHSDLLVQYADRTVVVKQEKNESTLNITSDTRDALDQLSRAGVSRWVHPLLFFPLDPIVLVEGSFDVLYFEEAFRVLRPGHAIRVADLSALDEASESGGIDKLEKYIRNNAPVIRARRKDAPVIVVLDWDASKKADKFLKLVDAPEVYKVMAWSDSALNPKLGKSFKGIERAHSDRIIKRAIKRGAAIGRKQDGQCMVSSEDYGEVKKLLAEIVKNGLTANDLTHARPFLENVLSAAGL